MVRNRYKDRLFRYYLWKTTDLSGKTGNDMFDIYSSLSWDCYSLYGHMNEKQTQEYEEVIENIELLNKCESIKSLWK